MSERYERAVQDWYNHSRTASLEYLDLSGITNLKLSDFKQNIDVIYDRLLLSSKVFIKHFHDLKVENSLIKVEIEECKHQLQKTQKDFSKAFQQISSEIRGTKPLTKAEVLVLIEEISRQPKKVEEEALRLTTELDNKLKIVQDQVNKVEQLVKEVQTFLTS